MSTAEVITPDLPQATTQHCLLNTHCLAMGLGIIVLLVIIKKYFSGGQYKQRNIDLTGKHALVTGGNSGIGA